MSRILVVEDEPDLRRLVEYNLKSAGHEVEAVGTGFEALRTLERRLPDLVVLDLMLPDLPGTHICRELRGKPESKALPVLMLTAKGEERDRVTGLEIGADDYVVKPVSMRELVLRVANLLRRGSPSAAAVDPAGDDTSAGPLRLDRVAHRAFSGAEEVDLTPLEFKLLELLLARKGRVQSRETLLKEVWQLDGEEETRTVDTHVKRLRQKLGARGDRIETVRGVGYRLRKETE